MSASAAIKEQLDQFRADFLRLRQEIGKVIVGQDDIVEGTLTALIAGGHVLLEEGRALARAGDGGWDPLVQRGRRAGRFDDELVEACLELLRRWAPRPAPRWVTAVPSRRSGALVPDFAQRLATALELPYVATLERRGDNPPQREMANSAQQVANVRGQFGVVAEPPGAPGLLVDDVRYSGWTLTTVGAQLRRKGAGALHPLVLSLAGA